MKIDVTSQMTVAVLATYYELCSLWLIQVFIQNIWASIQDNFYLSISDTYGFLIQDIHLYVEFLGRYLVLRKV